MRARVPSASVWIKEASPRQYSLDELVKMIPGTRRRAASRSRRPSPRPVTGSVLAASLNGNGVAHRRVQRGGGLSDALVEVVASSLRRRCERGRRRTPRASLRPR